jgi:UDP-hydrolysing UDP-N-acetyl-D-glucosamine 2-epimerase
MIPVLREIAKSEFLSLKIYATGMHLMPEFGETVHEVEKEFPDVTRLPAVFESDARSAQAVFSGALLPLLVSALQTDRPDFVLLLGDRPEMLCTALACVYLGIPTGHLHGGDESGTVDDVTRHAITKLAHVHFPATQEAAGRIVKMGEDPERIHVVGAPALDTILNQPLPTREELFRRLELDPNQQILLITQHPVTETANEAARQMEETLAAANSFEMPIVISYPNADPGGREMIDVIERERSNPRVRIFQNLPHTDFLALEREAAVWIGNSSGAMIESASFQTPVVNIGTRQVGRQRGDNVIDASHDRADITVAITRALSDPEFRARLSTVTNPWGDGNAALRVVRFLETLDDTSSLLMKRFNYE